MIEISTKKARAELSSLLKRVEKGEEVIIFRRGKQVARIVPVRNSAKRLPSLKDFRAGIRLRGQPLSEIVVQFRKDERY